MNKYWEHEIPVEVDTGKNVLRFFREAGRLQIAMPHWKDKEGQENRGKTVTINVSALRETPGALDMLREVINE